MIEKSEIRTGVKYSHEEVKHLLTNKFSNRPASRQATDWKDVDESIRFRFYDIQERVLEIDPAAVVYAYGSRISDLYRPDSDYDVTVITGKAEFEKIRQLTFDFKVDFRFLQRPGLLI